ncbi:MAG: hypothetical protein Q9O62_07665 [Ardenticatenia bacterium]|nr:hypothetical protein [Ardenticatenia bacterium]
MTASWWRPFWLAGLVGLLVGGGLSVVAWWVPGVLGRVALLRPDLAGETITRLFLIALGLIVVMEMPFMLFVMVRLARAGTVSGPLLVATHGLYVAFPGVYALLGSVLTQQRWWAWPMLFLCAMRLVLSLLALAGVLRT